jgi:anti-sigma regulatory factor (Ser/Thr protein kinase)
MDSFRTELPASTQAPQLVRGWLRTSLQTWQLDGCGAVTALLATELVSNVVAHVGEPMSVRISRTPEAIRVEIDDPDPSPPLLQHSDLTEDHGRGVFLVDALANRWGSVGHPGDGKTVWFELDVQTGHDEAHGAG